MGFVTCGVDAYCGLVDKWKLEEGGLVFRRR